MAQSTPVGSLTATNDSAAKGTLGHVVEYEGKRYRYVQVEDMALAANDVVELSDTTGYEVTKDRAGGSSKGRYTTAGVATTTATDAYYTYIQISGVATVKVPAATAVASGDRLVPHSTSDGAVAVATTATFHQAFAVALDADTATTSAAGTVTAKIFRAL